MPRPTFFALPEPKRQRVIDAAVAEFAAWPFGAASLDRIAAAAKVSKGSLYQYFEDKRELYGWLLMDYLPARKRATQTGLPGGLFEMLEAAFHAGLALFVAEPPLAALGARALSPAAEPEIRALHAAVRAATHAGLVALVQQAGARGELRAGLNPALAAAMLSSLMGTGLVEAVARQAGADLDAFVQDPSLAQKIPPEDLAAVVREATALLRRAIGAEPARKASGG